MYPSNLYGISAKIDAFHTAFTYFSKFGCKKEFFKNEKIAVINYLINILFSEKRWYNQRKPCRDRYNEKYISCTSLLALTRRNKTSRHRTKGYMETASP